MLRPSLNNPDEFPGDDVLALHLGPCKPAWNAFMALLQANAPPLFAEWRFYNDGKSWLCKVTRKSKTICWVAVWDRYFSAAFYLNAKAESLVRSSSLASKLKEAFLHSDARLRAIRVEVRKESDLEAVRELIRIKLKA